jgi:hypothetical protein
MEIWDEIWPSKSIDQGRVRRRFFFLLLFIARPGEAVHAHDVESADQLIG